MKKETLVAIILGLGLGTGVAFFLVFKTQEKKIENTKTISNNITNITKTPTDKNQSDFKPLEIIEPENNQITDKKNITIKGRAVKGSLIVIQSPIKELIIENKEEAFTADFPLALGENTILILAYNNKVQIEPQTKELKVYYLEE